MNRIGRMIVAYATKDCIRRDWLNWLGDGEQGEFDHRRCRGTRQVRTAGGIAPGVSND